MKKFGRIVFIGLLWVAAGETDAQHDYQAGPSDKSSVHGMLIFGKNKIYASHLPMFHAPHHYQIILELELDKGDAQKFIADQQQHPESATYTIEPEKFILPNKIAQSGSFKANLYRGHFERGGIKIADSIKVKIASVLYFKKFSEAEKKPDNAVFLLFGNRLEQFAAHQVISKPDFEQILQVQSELFVSDSSNKCVAITLSEKNAPVGVSGNAVSIKTNSGKEELVLLKQIYLEFDDLKE